ncbi:MAG: hypothetical protein ICV68_14025, partial [Pyrinomonadaceae bacterium]|nr:hypothetical protein [Pyrinomonadaceae bacterium]
GIRLSRSNMIDLTGHSPLSFACRLRANGRPERAALEPERGRSVRRIQERRHFRFVDERFMHLDKSVPLKSHAARRRPFARGAKSLIVVCALALAASVFGLVFGWNNSREGAAVRAQSEQLTGKINSMTEKSETNVEREDSKRPAPFYTALDEALGRRGKSLRDICDTRDPVARRVLEDYGAMFLATDTVLPPPVCVFASEEDVRKFQNEAKFTLARVGGDEIELQPAAMEALLAAREEARSIGLDITPRGGSEAARRSFTDTERLWATRFLPALTHWQRLGRLTREQTARLRKLPLKEQVREVLELEKSGIYFSKDFSKSILYSIAAPGTSQHIALLALDVEQFLDKRVRRILARHGWFQTVKSDLPHFTYLGLTENELPSRGLRSVKSGEQLFWIPNIE